MGQFRNVAVLMGGVSNERQVSLVSGAAVVAGLRELGHIVQPVILERESVDALPAGIEAVFLALHGGYGEDGRIQADLDHLGLPYTGSGSRASHLAMDKLLTKRVFVAQGIPTPESAVVSAGDERMPFAPPLVVKPPRDGSSVGVVCVQQASDWARALAEARRFDSEVLVERYIPGREWTVGIVGETCLPVVESQAPDGWYDFRAKYTKGMTTYVFPQQPEDAALRRRCQDLAWSAFQSLGARGLGRIDLRVTPDGHPYVLELNALPGFTPTSLLPKAAAHVGISFAALCDRVLQNARCDPPGAAAVQPVRNKAG